MLVVVNAFSHWVEAFHTKNVTALTRAKKLVYNLLCRCGKRGQAPKVIDSDKGRRFVASVVKEACTLLDIDQKFHIRQHPAAARQVEQMNRTIKSKSRKGMNATGRNWDEVLSWVLMHNRARECRSIGFSPYEGKRTIRLWEDRINLVPALS